VLDPRYESPRFLTKHGAPGTADRIAQMTEMSEERRREIVRQYWQVRRRHGEAAALEQLGVDYTLSPEDIRELVAEFPDEKQ
jgi:hypothetical protein